MYGGGDLIVFLSAVSASFLGVHYPTDVLAGLVYRSVMGR